jgi:hypothetical protein
MSSIESTNDYAAVPLHPDVELIMIPTAGREVVDVSIFSSGQNSLVIDVPVDCIRKIEDRLFLLILLRTQLRPLSEIS